QTDGLTVGQAAKPPTRFDRVTHCVSEVERGSSATLALVFGNHSRFHDNATPNQLANQVPVLRNDALRLCLQKLEHRRIADQRCLDDLSQSTDVATLAFTSQMTNVAQHTARLPERADAVLGAR